MWKKKKKFNIKLQLKRKSKKFNVKYCRDVTKGINKLGNQTWL